MKTSKKPYERSMVTYRILEGDKVAIPCRFLGGASHYLLANGKGYVFNLNPDLNPYHGSLYPIKILEAFSWPSVVPVFEGHRKPYGYKDTREALGIAKDIHYNPKERSARAWIRPYARIFESLYTGLSEDPPRWQVSGSFKIALEDIELNGKLYKLVTEIKALESIDIVQNATGGGAFLSEGQLLVRRIRT